MLRNGHLQTVFGRLLHGKAAAISSVSDVVSLPDGDRLVHFDSRPLAWRPPDPVVLIVHGLGGCADSPYQLGAAARFVAAGYRVVRMNLRGAGAGFGLSRGIYHAGRTEDVRAVAESIAASATSSPIALLGYSLGANLVLKLAAEAGAQGGDEWLNSVLAVNPPLDLHACCEHLRRGAFRIYDRHFVRTLRAQIDRLHARFPELEPVDWRPIRSLYDFDDYYTAPRNGFDGAIDYYARSSAGPMLQRIDRPGLVVHAADDPFIPVESLRSASFPSCLDVEIVPRGGHVGYVAHPGHPHGRRWLDARLADWLAHRFDRPIAR